MSCKASTSILTARSSASPYLVLTLSDKLHNMQGGEGLNSRSTTNGNAEDKGDLRLSTPCNGFKVVEKEYFRG
jgi:hypothetical protein